MGRRMTLEQLRQFDPHLTPDWRWRDACRAAGEGRRVDTARDTAAVAEAVAYLRALRRCPDGDGPERIKRRWPDLHMCHCLAEDPGPRLWEVQARVLAGQGDDEVARCCGLSVRAAGLFEALFFAVRDRLGARDWVTLRAVWGGRGPGLPMPDPGVVLRSAGYHGGPLVLEVVLAETLDRPLPARLLEGAHPADPTYEERLRLRARILVAAQTLSADVGLRPLLRLCERLPELGEGRPARGRVGTPAERVWGLVAGAELRVPPPADAGRAAAAAGA
mgnify:CR=1 FL=1